MAASIPTARSRSGRNRKPSRGYEVVRARFDARGNFVSFEPFVSGFLVPQPKRDPPLPGAQCRS